MAQQCSFCFDEIGPDANAFETCDKHVLCGDCITRTFKHACMSELNWPPNCCGPYKPLTLDIAKDFFMSRSETIDICTRYRERKAEFDTPAQQRIYCANPDCSIFLQKELPGFPYALKCPKCATEMCSKCKTAIDGVHDCNSNAKPEEPPMAEFGTEFRRKKCPNCAGWIELSEACNHIICVCKHQFCFVCLEPWQPLLDRCPAYGDLEVDEEGYDEEGYHRDTGLSRNGRSRLGYDKDGLDRDGRPRPAIQFDDPEEDLDEDENEIGLFPLPGSFTAQLPDGSHVEFATEGEVFDPSVRPDLNDQWWNLTEPQNIDESDAIIPQPAFRRDFYKFLIVKLPALLDPTVSNNERHMEMIDQMTAEELDEEIGVVFEQHNRILANYYTELAAANLRTPQFLADLDKVFQGEMKKWNFYQQHHALFNFFDEEGTVLREWETTSFLDLENRLRQAFLLTAAKLRFIYAAVYTLYSAYAPIMELDLPLSRSHVIARIEGLRTIAVVYQTVELDPEAWKRWESSPDDHRSGRAEHDVRFRTNLRELRALYPNTVPQNTTNSQLIYELASRLATELWTGDLAKLEQVWLISEDVKETYRLDTNDQSVDLI